MKLIRGIIADTLLYWAMLCATGEYKKEIARFILEVMPNKKGNKA